MKVVMVSNGLSHHQVPLCDWLSAHVDFIYIATKPISKERLGMGYADLNEKKPYVLCSYKDKENHQYALTLINQADFVISGSVPLGMVIQRVLCRKYIFWASERIYKDLQISWKMKLFWHLAISLANKRKTFLLAASAYSANDFSHFGLPQCQMLKWGYFPPIVNTDGGIKENNSIIWVGRFIDWKHPEYALQMALRLKKKGIPFKLTMVGDGALAQQLKDYCHDNDLTELVSFTCFLLNSEIHRLMAKTGIMIATSDFQEGWGAVINEAMGNACAVVASHAMGATRFLIKDGINGFIFKSGDVDDLTEKVERLLTDPELQAEIGKRAKTTILNEWNGEKAGERLLKIMEQLHQGKKAEYPAEGVCSQAPLLDNQWHGGGR